MDRCARRGAEEFQKVGALLKFEIPVKAATALPLVSLIAFAMFVSLCQDSALILEIVLFVVAVILEILEKRRQKQVPPLPAPA